METFNEKHVGDLEVIFDLQLNGVVTGSVTVPSGRHIECNGHVGKNLYVQAGASANVNGVVDGFVVNSGGDVRVYGVVGGVQDQGVRKTFIDQKAIIRR